MSDIYGINKKFEDRCPGYILGIGECHNYVSCCLLKNGNIKSLKKWHRSNFDYNLFCNIEIPTFLKTQYIGYSDIDYIALNHLIDPRVIPYEYFDKFITMGNHYAIAGLSAWPTPFNEAAVIIIKTPGTFDYNAKELCVTTEFLTYLYFNRLKPQIEILTQQFNRYWDGNSKFNSFCTGIFPESLYHVIRKKLHFMSDYKNNSDKELFDYNLLKLEDILDCSYYKKIRECIDLLPNGKFSISQRNLYAFIDSVDENNKDTIQKLARGLVKVVVDIMLHLSEFIYENTKCENLCLSGFIPFIDVIKKNIIQKTGFKKIIYNDVNNPYSLALGAALNVYHLHPKIKEYSTIKK